ncbi:hypothetical protein N8T08_007515 [Aspergillus melleus]|uniref:Uncharacterized protein n=1 Tax=Aspergillus melleus TaxID=138277 RepID=A0ACC3AXF4_9EURO|nr:hypothetical protein N8T08_007515 [Aspergillus melleus]
MKPPQEVQEQQDGVRVAETVTSSWSKNSLIAVYICMWLMYFVQALQSSLTASLSAYITSDFEGHSLLTVIGIVTNIMGAACTMPVAKILNLWNRTVGVVVVMLLVSIIGLILMARCHDIAMYCAAQAFYNVGLTGLIFCVDVLTSDTSSMRNRGLAFAFTSSPYMITALAGSLLSERFNTVNWRWAYGCVVIILPAVTVPLIVTWELAKRKVEKNLVLEKARSGRTWTQSAWYYFIEFDVVGILVGIFLLIAGFSFFLLAFVLAESQANKWQSASIICMIVVGGVMIYERFVAPKPFIPYHLLSSRTIIGACLLVLTYQIAYYCWNSYFTSHLQVVYDASMTQAGYISAIFDFVSPLWLFGAGHLVRVTGRFKCPGHSIGYMCMCEVFIGFGGGTIILLEQIAVIAASSHNDYASMLASLALFGNIGSAIGNSISGAIWTNTLPAETRDKWEEIANSLDVQLSYEMGSATREAINHAYAVRQRNMSIAGTPVMALTMVWVFMIKDIRVKGMNHVKGVVF